MWKVTILAALALVGVQTEVNARSWRSAKIVKCWYHQYLGRCVDPCGLRTWTGQLDCGHSPDLVLSTILGSQEYYQRSGCCQVGFIKRLYKDRLGRCPGACELRDWLGELGRCGCRQKLALKFLCASKRELGIP